MNINLLASPIEEDSYYWLIFMDSSFIGLHPEAGWCMRINGTIIELDEESKFVPLGPLLEIPPNDFSVFLQSTAANNPRLAMQIITFPREALLKHIFHTSYSSYWPERALAWLEEEKALWPKFQSELLTFSKNKVMPQRARQRAQKILQSTNN